MIRIYLLILLCISVLRGINAQDTFYKQYQFALDQDDENPEFLYNIDDTVRLISMRSVSAVGINFSLIDSNGEVISNIYHDDIGFFEEAILYDEEKEQFIIDGISRRDSTNKNCIFIMDKYGNLLETKCNEYGFPDDLTVASIDNILHMAKTDFGYVSCGAEFEDPGPWFALLNIFDKDLNLTFSDTLSGLRNIGNLAYDGEGGINAIGLVQNNDIFLIDSMLFMKINMEGEIIHQVRIPHTQGISQLNGHYAFITDTLSGNSYFMDKFDYDDGFSYKPRILKFDQWGNIIWDFHNWQSLPRLSTENLYLRKNGDLIAHGVVTFADVTTNLGASSMQLISIDQDGSFLWDRKLYELKTLGDQIERRYQASRDVSEDSNNNIYCSSIGAFNIADANAKKPFLIKLTPDGCYTNECKLVVNTGDYHKPNNLVTERNEIHIYNKDTGQRYRYTFSSRNRDVWEGGRLLKSNEMGGNDSWVETGREVRGSGFETEDGISTFIRENFDFNQGIPDIMSEWHYNFDYKVGDILELEHTFTNDVDFLEVVDIEEITLLDGRTKKQFSLECQNLDPDGNPYPPRIWIEDIGDINDFLNTPYACSNPSNEVITCFFSDGELIWQHPDYDVCTVNTKDIVEDKFTLFPNPTKDFLNLDIELRNYKIRDVNGKIIISGNSIANNESINVTILSSGAYILSGMGSDGSMVTKRFIKI